MTAMCDVENVYLLIGLVSVRKRCQWEQRLQVQDAGFRPRQGRQAARTQCTPNVCTSARAPNDAILNMKLLKPQKCGNDFLGQNCLVLCPQESCPFSDFIFSLVASHKDEICHLIWAKITAVSLPLAFLRFQIELCKQTGNPYKWCMAGRSPVGMLYSCSKTTLTARNRSDS